jgi:hypothetical protein
VRRTLRAVPATVPDPFRVFWENALVKQFLSLLAATVVLALASVSVGSPVSEFKPEVPQIPQLASKTYTLQFKGGQRANVIAIGDGSTFMGLYVYDVHGNCVAWDDEGLSQTRDDLALEWYPLENGYYIVEVRNCGSHVNQCKVWIR